MTELEKVYDDFWVVNEEFELIVLQDENSEHRKSFKGLRYILWTIITHQNTWTSISGKLINVKKIGIYFYKNKQSVCTGLVNVCLIYFPALCSYHFDGRNLAAI